jgi:hypothetical protein
MPPLPLDRHPARRPQHDRQPVRFGQPPLARRPLEERQVEHPAIGQVDHNHRRHRNDLARVQQADERIDRRVGEPGPQDDILALHQLGALTPRRAHLAEPIAQLGE